MQQTDWAVIGRKPLGVRDFGVFLGFCLIFHAVWGIGVAVEQPSAALKAVTISPK
jgi:hypothetical protein